VLSITHGDREFVIFLQLYLFTSSDSFSLGRTVLPQYKMSPTDDGQKTQCTKGSTDSMVGQKPLNFNQAFKCYQNNATSKMLIGFTLAGPPCIT